MPGNALILQPGEILTVVAVNPGVHPSHPIMLPGMPGWGSGGTPPYPDHSLPPFPSHPIVVPPGGVWPNPPQQPPTAGWPIVPGWGGSLPGGGGFPGQGGPVDPGYSPPWARPQPPYPDNSLPPFPSHPIVLPPTEPPPTTPPTDEGGNWVWAWSPQLGRWVWVKVPGEGEAGPKT